MLSRRSVVLSAAFVAVLPSPAAYAAEKVPYTAAAFDEANAAGRSILIEIHAPWCPTCKAQTPILSSIEAGEAFKSLVVFHVDFDSQKAAVRRFGAQMQSTLITFKGGKETGRSVGDTDPKSLAALLDKAI